MVCAALVAAVALLPLSPASAENRAMVLPNDPAPLVAETAAGARSFTIEVADDSAERSAGLMFRETMADDHGMLFVFDATQPVGFWMKNTVMPLDLLFIGEDGRIEAIKQGEPQSEAVISPGVPVRFVLELKAGTAARDGIETGDLVKHPLIGAGRDEPANGNAPQSESGNGG
jgi:uncharacterized membrane protein (UPF0127 family)